MCRSSRLLGLRSYAIVCVMTIQPELTYPAWTLGDRIRKARMISGMKQAEFAERIGTKEGSLAAWETDRSTPRNIVAIAKRIEALTRVPATWILGLDDGPPYGGPDDDGGAAQPVGWMDVQATVLDLRLAS